MREYKIKGGYKVLAVLISLIMIFLMMPIQSVVVATEEKTSQNGINLQFLDSGGTVNIIGATVSYSIKKSADDENPTVGETDDNDNDNDGKINIGWDFTVNPNPIVNLKIVQEDENGNSEEWLVEELEVSSSDLLIVNLITDVTITSKELTYNDTDQELIEISGSNSKSDTFLYKTYKNEENKNSNEITYTDEVPKEKDAGKYTVYVKQTREFFGYNVIKEYIVNSEIEKADIFEENSVKIEKPTENLSYGTDDEVVEKSGDEKISEDEKYKYTWNIYPINKTVVNLNDSIFVSNDKNVPTVQDIIEYADDNNKNFGIGSYRVGLTISIEGVNYNDYVTTADIEIISGEIDITGLKISVNELVHDGKEQELLTVETPIDYPYEIQYQLIDVTENQEINENAWVTEKPKATNAGEYLVYVKLVQTYYEDTNFPDQIPYQPYKVDIDKANQDSEIKFNTGEYNEGSLEIDIDSLSDEGYDFSILGGNDNGKKEYILLDNSDEKELDSEIAEINAENGILTINKPGLFRVQATNTGDPKGSDNDNYIDLHRYCYITVKTTDAESEFPSENISYTLNSINNSVSDQEVNSEENDDREATYSIKGYTDEQLKDIGLVIDSNEVKVSDYKDLSDSMIENENKQLKFIVEAEKESIEKEGYKTINFTKEENADNEEFADVYIYYFTRDSEGKIDEFDSCTWENTLKMDVISEEYGTYTAKIPNGATEMSFLFAEKDNAEQSQDIVIANYLDEDQPKEVYYANNDEALYGKYEIKKVVSEIYPESSASYELIIKFAEISDSLTFVATDDKSTEVDSEKWYNSGISVKEDGYYINIPSADWLDTEPKWLESFVENLIFENNGDGEEDERKVQLINNKNEVTAPITLNSENNGLFKIDTELPTGPEISYSDSIFSKVLEGITFGFYNAPVTVTFTAYDNYSGINSFEWKYSREEYASEDNVESLSGYIEEAEIVQDVSDKSKYTASITLPSEEAQQLRGNISLKVSDKATNTTELTDEKNIIVVDTISPKLTASYSQPSNTVGKTMYYDGDIVVTLNLEENNFYTEDVNVTVTKDGEEQPTDISWESSDSKNYTSTFTLSGDGDYVVNVNYTDKSDNEMVSYSDNEMVSYSDNEMVSYTSGTLTIDTTKAELGFEFNKDEGQKATFTVEEHNFRPEDITVSGTIKDINNNVISELDTSKMTDVLRKSAWEQDSENPDIYTYVYYSDKSDGEILDFLENGIYDIDIGYKDISGNVSETNSPEDFIIDYEKPSKPEISYSDSIFSKFLEGITFGFYNAPVTVTFTAYDNYSGINSFDWKYSREEYASKDYVESLSGYIEETEIVQDESNKSKFTASITLPSEDTQQLRGNISVKTTDNYDNSSSEKLITDEKNIIVVDTISPKLTASYSQPSNTVGKTMYYDGDIVVTLNLEENNFYTEDVNVTVTKDGEEQPTDISWESSDSENYTSTFTLSGDGDYVVNVNYTDKSYNEMVSYTSDTLTIDTTKAELEFEFNKDEGQKATFTVEEHNFRPEDITVSGTIKDINNNVISELDTSKMTDVLRKSAWEQDSENPDIYTYVYYSDKSDGEILDFLENGIYDIDIDYKDISGNVSETNSPEDFIIDYEKPSEPKISYSAAVSTFSKVLEGITFGFYNAPVTVTFTAYDNYSGINSFDWKYSREEYTSKDNVESLSGYIEETEIVQDESNKSKFTASITLPTEDTQQLRGNISVKTTDNYDNSSSEELITDEKNIIVVDTISPKLTASYSQPSNTVGKTMYYDGDIVVTLNLEENNFYTEDVNVTVTKDGEEQPTDISWESSDSKNYTSTFTLSGDGDYVVNVNYTDKSDNEMVSYTSGTLTIDTTKAELGFEFNKDEGQKATFTVEEYNFRPEDITVSGTIKDINNNVISELDTSKMTDVLRKSAWEQDSENPDIYTYVYYSDKSDGEILDFLENGIYDIDIDYKDISGNVSETNSPEDFIIDYENPSEPEISYSDTVSVFDKLLEVVTFGFYNAPVTVTFTAYDNYSGINSFDWKYSREEYTSKDNVESLSGYIEETEIVQDESNKSKFTASITLPSEDTQQLRGNISVKTTDNYDNSSSDELITDEDNIIVVDTISPKLTVSYSEPSNTVGNTMYYDGDIVVTLNLEENNFYTEDVNVTVTKDGDLEQTDSFWISSDSKNYTSTFTLSGDGDYVVNVNYTDKSDNEMVSYTSDTLTIDTIDPVINVEYQNNNVINVLEDSESNSRKYFDDNQRAVITINEHNFNSDDVNITLIAQNVSGAEVNNTVLPYNWISNGDIHVLEINLTNDANYTFDIDYTDFATRKAADYQTDYFTVDKTNPLNLQVEYSTSVLETVLETISFGFYNAKMLVTLTAEDYTSKISEFEYSYENVEGASLVNEDLLNQSVDESSITYSDDLATAQISFEVPKMILGPNNQFNGTVRFNVFDRSGNETEKIETKQIVVDNIKPISQVSYNTPVNIENNISYYNGDINATIVINEANFHSEDVNIVVTRDGQPVNINTNWAEESVDSHIGTFTLTQDGDYIVTVNYKDKSSNEMTSYKSEQLTIDTTINKPIISVNGNTENGMAYKNTVIAEVEFSDINFNDYDIKFTRTNYGNKNEELNEEFIDEKLNLNSNGGSVVLENIEEILENDGIYTMLVEMDDKSGNSIKNELVFTVNRFGSVYEYSDYLTSLVADGGAYETKITDDLIITEYNADELVKDSLNIEITKDGFPLENINYTASPEKNTKNSSSDWFEYKYTINKDNFSEDGVYKISISSKDETGNMPENSNYEDKNILFRVDTTKPEITSIVGLENGIVNAQDLTVKYTVFDAIGLKSIQVFVDDKEINESIVDFTDDMNNYQGSFTLAENGSAQNVRIVIEDMAGNIVDTATDEFESVFAFNDNVTISTNALVRWQANPILFWGSIIGAVVVVAGAMVITSLIRKKNNSKTK